MEWVVSYHRWVSFWARCRVTLSVMEGVLIPPLPEGRLDTLHDSLYLYHCFCALFVCSASLLLSPSTFPLSLTISASVLHLILSAAPSPPSIFPSALHRAMAVNRLQELRQGLRQDQSCNVQMGRFVHSAGMLTGYSTEDREGFQSPPPTEADRSASKIMSDNDAL